MEEICSADWLRLVISDCKDDSEKGTKCRAHPSLMVVACSLSLHSIT
jgi:hypothetical protein